MKKIDKVEKGIVIAMLGISIILTGISSHRTKTVVAAKQESYDKGYEDGATYIKELILDDFIEQRDSL